MPEIAREENSCARLLRSARGPSRRVRPAVAGPDLHQPAQPGSLRSGSRRFGVSEGQQVSLRHPLSLNGQRGEAGPRRRPERLTPCRDAGPVRPGFRPGAGIRRSRAGGQPAGGRPCQRLRRRSPGLPSGARYSFFGPAQDNLSPRRNRSRSRTLRVRSRPIRPCPMRGDRCPAGIQHRTSTGRPQRPPRPSLLE